jgi:hypothetical protein
MRRSLTGLLLLVPALLAAQDHDHGPAPKIEGGGQMPAGWALRTDQEGQQSKVKLEPMPPGWHLTTAASGIMYRLADSLSGTYEVSSKLHLFPAAGGHAEAFGVFIGGQNLNGLNQRYTYFLIRGDGTFKVKAMNGTRARDITPGWTKHAAILPGKADGPVANTITIAVGKDKVSFKVNGQEVWSGPASELDVAGVAGLRVNHNLSIHVETLEARRS